MPQKIQTFVIFLVSTIFTTSCISKGPSPNDSGATEIPHAVSQSFLNRYPGAIIQQYREFVENGNKQIEIIFHKNGERHAVIWDVHGHFLAEETALPVENLPVLIREKIAGEVPHFQILQIKRRKESGKNSLNVEIINIDNQQRVTFTFKFSENGELIARERS